MPLLPRSVTQRTSPSPDSPRRHRPLAALSPLPSRRRPPPSARRGSSGRMRKTTTNPTGMRHAVRRRAWSVSAGAWVPTAGAPMRSDQLYVPPCFCAPTFASRAKCIVWAILGDQGLCYVLRLRRGAVLRVTALGSVCVTCYGFRWELCNTVLRVTAFWVCNTGRSRWYRNCLGGKAGCGDGPPKAGKV